MAISVYGISGNTPPSASQSADFSDLKIAVSITATFTNPKKTDPKKLNISATEKAINTSKPQKLFKNSCQTNRYHDTISH